ncbi:carboxylesterase/lipase family protein [Bifidobacterium sp.]|uniref:carboxylesterase/lipase family protein n=1 Tax=Bifidobacterium sp. TaxID=41200 RepID=UPI0039E87A1C
MLDENDNLTVTTNYGPLQGIHGKNPNIRIFKGIPYAKPPTGGLRWREPQRPEPWNDIRKAFEFGPVGPQLNTQEISAMNLPMDEDCLYLNIWAASGTRQKPVLVWIYGGGFQEGTSADPNFDGESMAERGIIVVNFNYRLGILGFLATQSLSSESPHGVSGNYGFLDCVAALRWVHENIAAFGGDPSNVTIAGQSAGAGTCDFLAMSPLAKGLFRRVIAQSHARYSRDTELRYLSTSYRNIIEAEDAGERFVRRLCTTDETPTLERLREVPWQELTDSKLYGDVQINTGSDSKPPLFRPVVDGWSIPHGFEYTYASGEQNDVDYIVGNNLDESGAIPTECVTDAREKQKNERWRPGRPPTHVTLESFVRAAKYKYRDMADEFLSVYSASNDDEAAAADSRAVRDNARISSFLWAQEWRKHCNRPVRTYFWTHRTPDGSGQRRAFHGSEITYAFDNLNKFSRNWTAEDVRVSKIISAYWVNFIATGDPNGDGLPEWKEYDPDVPKVMDLGSDFVMRDIASPKAFSFWQRFFATQQAW